MNEAILREICAYLGYDARLPLGTVRVRDLYATQGRWRLEIEGEDGTLGYQIAATLAPLYEARGEGLPDARIGLQAVIAALLADWPSLPVSCSSTDWSDTFGGREWLRQGSDWEYVDVDGRAVVSALLAGESAESVRSRVFAADTALVRDHRAARRGDKARPMGVRS